MSKPTAPPSDVNIVAARPIERVNSADQHIPQEDPSGQGAGKFASAAKGKGKEVCCPSTGRNICVSSDGTLGDFGEKNSNVVELQSRIIKDKTQLSYYISGIGTYGDSDIRRWWDAAVASSFERNVLEAYKWLCDTYEPGDRIFLFGFSRGAYQVRVIAGMIHLVGLLYRGNHTQIPSAFKLYTKTMHESQQKFDQALDAKKGLIMKEEPDTTVEQKAEDEQKTKGEQKVQEETKQGQNTKEKKKGSKKPNVKQQCQTFKKAFSQPDVKVHFVGAWDTVSSVGLIRKPCLPETTSGMGHVCHFRQALALDERRVKFWPEYANTSSPESPTHGDVKEVWFAGSHSDIGGWSQPNENLDSFGPALRWMTYEAMNNGLRIRQPTNTWLRLIPEPSLTWGWHILEYLPLLRPSNKHGKVTRRLHKGAPRRIQDHQFIHESVFEEIQRPHSCEIPPPSNQVTFVAALISRQMRRFTRHQGLAPKYQPSAHLPRRGTWVWDDNHHLEEMIERDPFSSATSSIQMLKNAVEFDPDDATFDAAILFLQNHVLLPWNRAAGHVVAPSREGQGSKALAEVSDASLVLLLALEREVNRPEKMRTEIMTILFSALEIVPPTQMLEHKASKALHRIGEVLQCDYSWQSPYRQVVQRHGNRPLDQISVATKGWAKDITFTGNNEEQLLVASNKVVEIWDRQRRTSKTVISFDAIRSGAHNVRMSEDGSRCVIGHQDGSARLWDIVTEHLLCTLRPEGEADPLNAVALSSDNSKITSGSSGGVIRIWDINAETDLHGEMVGHTGEIDTVAFSTDGSQLASGADDCTIRLWNTINGQESKVLKGHTHYISSLVFSTCGGQIISASWDHTVCIWDTTSGKLMKKLLGHTRDINCSIISPNQKFVASGSDDRTVRVWDAMTGETLVVYNADEGVLSLHFSRDGDKLVSGTYDGDIQIWDTSLLLYVS